MIREADYSPTDDAIELLLEKTGKKQDRIQSKDLLNAVNDWLTENGFEDASAVALRKRMGKKGYKTTKSNVIYYTGVRWHSKA